MDDHPAVVLLTRPIAQSERCAKALHPIPVTISPVSTVELLNVGGVPADKTLILTSTNAIRAIERAGHSLSGHDVVCTGENTAEMVSRAGGNVVFAVPTAKAMLAKLLKLRSDRKFHYLRAEEVSVDICAELRSSNIRATEAIVYRIAPQPLSDQAQGILGANQKVILPVFSEQSGRRLAACLGEVKAPICLVAISQKVADDWVGPTPINTVVATEPVSGAMVRAIRSHFPNLP